MFMLLSFSALLFCFFVLRGQDASFFFFFLNLTLCGNQENYSALLRRPFPTGTGLKWDIYVLNIPLILHISPLFIVIVCCVFFLVYNCSNNV